MFVAAGLQLEIDPWMMQLACLAWVSFFAIQAARESAFLYYGTMILWEFLVLPTGANFDSSALVFRASAATHKSLLLQRLFIKRNKSLHTRRCTLVMLSA